MSDFIVIVYQKGTKNEIKNKVFLNFVSEKDVRRHFSYNPNKVDIEIYEITVKTPAVFQTVT